MVRLGLALIIVNSCLLGGAIAHYGHDRPDLNTAGAVGLLVGLLFLMIPGNTDAENKNAVPEKPEDGAAG